MPRLLKHHRQILYQLKRDWGLTVTLYKPLTATHDVTTGEIARSFDVQTVDRAPVLPASKTRSFVYDLAYIAADKNFTEGAFFDKKQRVVIIEQRDLPKLYMPELDDFLIFNTQQYEIKKIEVAEELAAFNITVVAVDNQERVKWLTAKSKVTLTPIVESV